MLQKGVGGRPQGLVFFLTLKGEKAGWNREICLPAPSPRCQRVRADCKGAASHPALTRCRGAGRAVPKPEPPSWPPNTSAPTESGEAGTALPSLCARAAWLAAYFPSWQASRCRQGNACGELFILLKFAVGPGTWGASGRQRPGLLCLGLSPPVWYKSASLGTGGGQGEKTPAAPKGPPFATCRSRTTFDSPLLGSARS